MSGFKKFCYAPSLLASMRVSFRSIDRKENQAKPEKQ